MSWLRVLLALACLAGAAALDRPSLACTTPTFTYDLTSARPYLPIAWGAVALAINASGSPAQVRFTVRFYRDTVDNDPTTDATDLLTVRSGLGVEVASDTAFTTYVGANWLVATGKQTWTWSGPVHGGTAVANRLVLTSDGLVDQADALRALRQVFYANLGGPRAMVRRQLVLTIERNDGAAWTISPNTILSILKSPAAPPPMPVQLRFEPVALVQGGAAVPLRLADLAGTITPTTTATLLPTALPPGLVLSGTLDLRDPPRSGLLLCASAEASAGNSGTHACQVATTGLAGAATSFLEVAVTNDASVLNLFGNPPLRIDVTTDGTTSGTFQTNTTNLDLAITSHPGAAPLSVDEVSALGSAITYTADDGQLTVSFDHASLREWMTGKGTDALLACALRFTIHGSSDGPAKVIPCQIQLHSDSSL